MRPTARASTVLAGVLLGSTGLWLAFRGLEVDQLRRAVDLVDPGWCIAALASTFLSLVLLSLRWRLLFFPDHRHRRLLPLFRAIVVGQMLNIVLPVRLGEVGRLYVFARDEGISKSRILATLAVEKALDLGMFALGVVVALTAVALPEGVGLRRSAQWGVAVAGLAGLWLLAERARRIEAIALRLLGRLPSVVGRRLAGIMTRFLEGLSSLREPRVTVAALAWSVAVLLSAALTNYLLFRAFGWTLPPVAALFLLVLIQAGFVPPSLPGKIGIFHYLVVVGLVAFGIERGPALAYAWALYAIAILPKVLLGALLMLHGGAAAVAAAVRSTMPGAAPTSLETRTTEHD